MANTGDLSKGCFIRFSGDLLQIVELENRTISNNGFSQVKMRNIQNNRIVEYRFRNGETIDLIKTESKKYTYFEKEGDYISCMETETSTLLKIPDYLFGSSAKFLKKDTALTILFDELRPVYVAYPINVELLIDFAEPGVKGDALNKAKKPVRLETGAIIQAPLFINKGDKIKLNTETGEFIERIK